MTADVVIVGAGLAGCTLAWTLHWLGLDVRLLDREDPTTASLTAAGLLTPVTGRRLTKSNRYQEYWSVAERFYRRAEEQTNENFFSRVPTLRYFSGEEEAQWFLEHRQQFLGDTVKPINNPPGLAKGFEMFPAGRLRVDRFCRVTRRYFAGQGRYQKAEADPDSDIQCRSDSVHVRSLDLTSQFLVLCQGFQQKSNHWFPQIPDSPARGDILTVRIPGFNEDRVIHRGVWLVPEGPETYLLGSTYDWKDLSGRPSPEGRNQLLGQLQSFVNRPVRVVEHKAAVRPGMKNYQPAAALHTMHSRVGIFNGLGAKGSLWAPWYAQQLADQIQQRSR